MVALVEDSRAAKLVVCVPGYPATLQRDLDGEVAHDELPDLEAEMPGQAEERGGEGVAFGSV